MQTVLAEMSQLESQADEMGYEGTQDDQSSGDRISSRGLEILRILNEVFNRLPAETGVRTKEVYSARG
jgi:hypothetical protein